MFKFTLSLPIFLCTFLLAPVSCQSKSNSPPPSLKGTQKWICFYGKDLPDKIYKNLDMAILDPDEFKIRQEHFEFTDKNKKPFLIGYISIGEVETFRWYWPKAKGKPYVLDPNPNWPESHYIDIRSRAWETLLFEEVIPKIFEKGYQGLFLDTLDTAQYLQDVFSKRFPGSVKALENFIRELRRRFPEKLIITNNALPLLKSLGTIIDGALVEDLYAGYDFEKKAYLATDPSQDDSKEKFLNAFMKDTGHPVYVIIYSDSKRAPHVPAAIQKTKEKGYLPYIAPLDLNKLGVASP